MLNKPYPANLIIRILKPKILNFCISMKLLLFYCASSNDIFLIAQAVPTWTTCCAFSQTKNSVINSLHQKLESSWQQLKMAADLHKRISLIYFLYLTNTLKYSFKLNNLNWTIIFKIISCKVSLPLKKVDHILIILQCKLEFGVTITVVHLPKSPIWRVHNRAAQSKGLPYFPKEYSDHHKHMKNYA